MTMPIQQSPITILNYVAMYKSYEWPNNPKDPMGRQGTTAVTQQLTVEDTLFSQLWPAPTQEFMEKEMLGKTQLTLSSNWLNFKIV